MTVVVGATLNGHKVIISDSRATIESRDGSFSSDNLQKIVGLNDSHIVGYSGDVKTVQQLLTEYQYYLRENNEDLDSRLAKLTEFSQTLLKMYKEAFSIILCTKDGDAWTMHQFKYPQFSPEEVIDMCVIGSGSVIAPQLTQFYNSSKPFLNDDKQNATLLVSSLMSLLSSPSVNYVGGMPQVLLLGPRGVQTLHMGYINVEPEGQPDSKQIIYEDGKWVQHDYANGSELSIVSPEMLSNGELSEKIFYNYDKPEKRVYSWYLNSFALFQTVDVSPGETKFGTRLGSLLALELPQEVECKLYISAFGPSTEHDIEISIIDKSGQETILITEHFNNVGFPNEFEFIRPLRLNITKRGKHYLVCKFNGVEVGRKVLYVYNPRSEQPIEKTMAEMTSFLNGYTDKSITAPQLSLLGLGNEESTFDGQKIILRNQFSVAFYKSFPFKFNAHLLVVMQANPGEHEFRFELLNSADKKIIFSGGDKTTSTSITNLVPVMAKLTLSFEKPGIYFINVYLDEKLVGAVPVMADGNPAMLTYNLPEDSKQAIARGELLLLAKRPIQQD